ncbi:MAG: repressor LexA [Gemmatimonadaceae bacterium]|nr:repressor LexA [Gemmatimonadaceae bacterium]
MSDVLTPVEEKVYQYLIEFLAANSYQPSIREIGREFDIKSTKTVSDVLGSLARKGYIQRNQARSRGLRILGAQAGATRTVPFYARVSAAGPAITPELRSDAIVVDRRLVPGDNAFFVRVVDDGMLRCGIRRDDTVLVNPDYAALDGDLVAVRIGDEATVRTVEQRGAETVLVAMGDAAPAITVAAGDTHTVLGVVSGIFRAQLQVEAEGPDAEAAA